MEKLRTLTVPDVIWINREITGSPQPHDFLKVEGAVFCQYNPGGGIDLPRQAARLLHGLKKKDGFTHGNDATAFAATLAFLRMNGLNLELDTAQATAWAHGFWDGQHDLSGHIVDYHLHLEHGVAPVREICGEIFREYADTLDQLLSDEPPVPATAISTSRLTSEHV